MKSIACSIAIFAGMYHCLSHTMEKYEQLPRFCKKITARKMLESPNREAYADVLNEQSISPRQDTKKSDSIIARCAEALKNETLELLEKTCKENDSRILPLTNPLVEERLNDEIVSHLSNIGALKEQQTELHSHLQGALDRAERKMLNDKLKKINRQLSIAAVRANIAEHALSVRNTTIFLLKEREAGL